MGSDFNGDGRDDILWIHDNGALTNWLGAANGGFIENYDVNSSGNGWFSNVFATGDFNGDGRADLLRQGNRYYTYFVSELGTASGDFVHTNPFGAEVPYEWRIAGIGDFNGDGVDDLLWRHDSGTLTDWLGTAGGGFIENYGALSREVPIEWRVTGSGDFNGDGRDDILWSNGNSGQVDYFTYTDWLCTANGGFVENYGALSVDVPYQWSVRGIGDYNGDGRDDILWREHFSGTLTDWLGTNNGGFVENYDALFREVPIAWHVYPYSTVFGYF